MGADRRERYSPPSSCPDGNAPLGLPFLARGRSRVPMAARSRSCSGRSSSGGDAGDQRECVPPAFRARPPRVPDPRSGTSFRGTRFGSSSRVPGD
jgi:hypothetical protein